MREIVIRRHAYTKKGASRGKGSHISAEGVNLARKVSQESTMGRFAKVFCSDIPRTLETAIAMGYAVDDALVAPPGLMEAAMDVVGHHERWSWEYPWQMFATYLRSPGPVENLGTWLRQSWIHVLRTVEDGERVLGISHGRVIEIGAIACLPDIPTDEFVNWGDALRHGEGVRLSFADGGFGNPVLLRTHGQD